jgi:DNA-binding GntR family transcriptional regulator
VVTRIEGRRLDATLLRNETNRPMTGKNRVPRLERSMLSDQVSRVITDGLLSGQFKPGDSLVENDLSEMLGVSRSPIREALVELQNAGLITKEPGRRAVIRRWSARDLEELFAIRALLEGYAARLATVRGKGLEFDPLREIVAAMRDAAAVEDFARLVQLDLEFHEMLWSLSGNELLRTVLEGLKQQFRLFLTMNWKFHGGANQVHENHQVVIDALESGDPNKAEEIMQEHVVVERMVAGERGAAVMAHAGGVQR